MERFRIGVISEGPSDYWVLRHIVDRYLKELNARTFQLQPVEQKKGEEPMPGGWTNVFRYLREKQDIIQAAFDEDCKYIIIQIDTDTAVEYGVKVTDDYQKLYVDVVARIKEELPLCFDFSKIIFAVSINSIECWLISFFPNVKNSHCCKIHNCTNTLNIYTNPKGFTINDEKKGECERFYVKILNQQKKAKDIKIISKYNLGFTRFIESLDNITNNVRKPTNHREEK